MRRRAGESDLEPAGRRAEFVRVRTRLRRRCIGRVVFRITRPVEHRGAVAQAACQHMIDDKSVGAVAVVGAAGIAILGGLQSDEAALRGGNADAAEPVTPMRDRHHARRDGRGGTARRTAGAVIRIPRIAADAVITPLRRARNSKFGHIGLACEDETGGAIAAHQFRVARRAVVEQKGRAVRERPAGDGKVHVLDEKGHASERPVRKFSVRSRARLVVRLVHDRVEFRIVALDARDGFLEKFA